MVDIKENEWQNASDKLPEYESYFEVMYEDGTVDEKPFRIRPSKNIYGFMTLERVVKWRELPQ